MIKLFIKFLRNGENIMEETKIEQTVENTKKAVNIVETNEIQQTSLLEGLEKLQKKHLFYQRVSCLFIVILTVGVLSVIPPLIHTLDLAQETMTNANTAIVNANDMIIQAQDTLSEISNMVINSEQDIETTMVGINDAMQGLTSIDFEGLNTAINDLESVVAPLARLFGGKR